MIGCDYCERTDGIAVCDLCNALVCADHRDTEEGDVFVCDAPEHSGDVGCGCYKRPVAEVAE